MVLRCGAEWGNVIPVDGKARRVLFTGTYEHTIDDKQRLAVPADIRAQWRDEAHGSAFFAVPWPGNLIRLYTEKHFQTLAASRSLTLTPDEDEAELQATLFGLSRRVEMDKAGRIRLHEDLLAMTGLPKEVVLVGAGDRLEIRDRAAWKATQTDRLNHLPELIRRINAKKQPPPPLG